MKIYNEIILKHLTYGTKICFNMAKPLFSHRWPRKNKILPHIHILEELNMRELEPSWAVTSQKNGAWLVGGRQEAWRFNMSAVGVCTSYLLRWISFINLADMYHLHLKIWRRIAEYFGHRLRAEWGEVSQWVRRKLGLYMKSLAVSLKTGIPQSVHGTRPTKRAPTQPRYTVQNYHTNVIVALCLVKVMRGSCALQIRGNTCQQWMTDGKRVCLRLVSLDLGPKVC